MKRFYFSLLILICFGCKPNLKYPKVEMVLSEFYADYKVDFPNKKLIFILTDKDCISCNLSLNNLLISEIRNSNFNFIVSVNSSLLNIKEYQKSSNVIIDFSGKFSKNNVIKSSLLIMDEMQHIDSIIVFNAENLKEKLAFAKKLIHR